MNGDISYYLLLAAKTAFTPHTGSLVSPTKKVTSHNSGTEARKLRSWVNNNTVKYQSSGEGGTRSPPATPHRLRNSKWPPGGRII